MKLNLGVFDVPEWNGQPLAKVAHILEDRYRLFSTFANDQHAAIEKALHAGVEDALVNLVTGAPAGADPFAGACSEIDATFQRFLDTSRIEKLGINGVPTGAAKKGVNHRLKIRRGKRRPSFIDTGILRTNFVSWVDR